MSKLLKYFVFFVSLVAVFSLGIIFYQKEIRKPISPQTILSNWQLAKKEKINELTAIYYSEEPPDEDIEKRLKQLKFIKIER